MDENEPILCFIQVVDYLKQQQQFKKITKEELAGLLPNTKQYYFLATSRPLNSVKIISKLTKLYFKN